MVRVAIAVHSPYTCSPGLVVKAASLAAELGLHINVHLAETEGETAVIRSRYGMTPTEYLYKYGLLGPRTVAHHSIHLSPEDIRLLQDSGTSVVTLPNSNMKLGSGACRVSVLHDAGINVALGTDGPASNNSQSMVRELQQLGRLERIRNLDPTSLSSRELLQMATIRGARAYGLDHLTGSLEPGKSADLQVIDIDRPHWQPLYDPYHSIAYAMQSDDVETLLVAGRMVMKDRALTLIDEERILWEARKLAAKIRKEISPLAPGL